MQIARLEFKLNTDNARDFDYSHIENFLGSLRMNGQILGREIAGALELPFYTFNLMIPESGSLDEKNANKHVRKWQEAILSQGITFSIQIEGKVPDSADVCICAKNDSYILYTTYLSIESQLRCGACFGAVPLYRIRPLDNDEYSAIIEWNSDYQACDTLQMNCQVGERFALAQLGKHTSALSGKGLEICSNIYGLTGVPVYYYLFRNYGRNLKQEKERRCPGCGGEWLLNEPWHRIFDFRCDRCRLLSNIAMGLNR